MNAQQVDGPALFRAAQSSLHQSGQVSMADGHALLCATQAVAQAVLALTAATVDGYIGKNPEFDTEMGAAWRRAVHPS